MLIYKFFKKMHFKFKKNYTYHINSMFTNIRKIRNRDEHKDQNDRGLGYSEIITVNLVE